MPTPSLLIVPARFKSGKLYSQLPTSGAGDFTVTRATNATRVNASGLIESVASGIPRLDYFSSDGTVGCPALLVEPSGTNTLLGSVSLDTGWTAFVSNRTSGITSPSGSNDATLFQAESIAGRIRFTPTLTSGTTYTFSCFGKLGTLSSGFTLQVIDENTTTYGSGCCQAFNLNEGTLGASGNVGAGFTLQSVGMENYGSGWYRCRMTVLMGYTPTIPRIGFRIGTQLSAGRPLSVVSGTVNAWGAQLETGSVATSYIPTTTAAVTRSAEVVSVSGAVSGSIGQTQGTIYLDLTVLGKGSSSATRWVQIFGPSNNIGLAINSSNLFRSIVNTQSDTLITAPLISSGVKVAWAYDATGTTCFINGTQYTLTTGGNQTMSSLTSISIDGSANTAFGFARIRAAALYNTRLTNAELAALTSP